MIFPYLEVLLNANYSQSSNKQNKQKWQLLDDSENELVEKQAHMEHAYKIGEKNTCKIGIQTNKISVQITNETREIGVQVSDITSHALESQVYLLRLQLNSKISEIEDLKN
ncbi:17762_t:CDS:2 [Cetraspora pellucida]|uniref:17762_t:CDS:1 n=1 Tax=Cetraspora pellucida TaxID=1433469 RepID=A0A9N8ZCU5_9GLOM|nr:17762_t:CDS:2 [Cetraspora pellucida]